MDTLADVAAVLDRLAVVDQDDEARVRACLSNLLIGVERRHIERESAERRLSETVRGFFSSSVRDYGGLLDAHTEALYAFREADHYVRPGPLAPDFDIPALTIQANEDGVLGEFWLGRRARGAEIADAFAVGGCRGVVGAPGRALWLTPYQGHLRDLCEQASIPGRLPQERSILARRLVSALGLCHVHKGDEVLAFVTQRSIGELAFRHPVLAADRMPCGSTAIEARGHRRFRPWPAPFSPDTYGRTYALDKAERAAARPRTPHGFEEAVRPALEMTEFDRCIFVGALTDSGFDDDDAEFLDSIGARSSSPDLLRRLSGVVGP